MYREKNPHKIGSRFSNSGSKTLPIITHINLENHNDENMLAINKKRKASKYYVIKNIQ